MQPLNRMLYDELGPAWAGLVVPSRGDDVVGRARMVVCWAGQGWCQAVIGCAALGWEEQGAKGCYCAVLDWGGLDRVHAG